MDENLKQEIKAMVDGFFSEKEEAEIRRKTEEALQESAEAIKDLTTALEDKNSESEKVVARITDLEQQVVTLTSELEAAKTAKSDAEAKFEEVSKLLSEKKKDEVAAARVAELVKAGVGNSDYAVKVRDMSDEDFTSFLSERVDLRKAVIAELDASKAKADAEAAALVSEESTKAQKSEVAVEVDVEEEELKTPPAQISHSQAVSAALNFETIPSKSVMDKYTELGKAFAKLMNGTKDTD